MKQKEVEDVLGGKEEFKNADSMASTAPCVVVLCLLDVSADFINTSSMSLRNVQWRACLLLSASDPQCR
jgi:hypothetical protein